jgi:hypothetical protein
LLVAQVPLSAIVDQDTAEINTTPNVIAPGVLANESDEDEILKVTKFSINLDLLL